MLTSNVVIWSSLLNFLVSFRLPLPPPPTEAGCNWLELPLVVQEQFFRRLVGYVFPCKVVNFTNSQEPTPLRPYVGC